ncbi:MAG TPA: phosphoribosyltransferase family protein [Phnomibacter sp.]|nr:phosphoribosyltransferase family protein [Phnomibacter sp.]
MNKTYILRKEQVDLKLRRMALEIAEQNTNESNIVLAGVMPNGPIMIQALRQTLAQHFSGTITEISIEMDKRHPETVELSAKPDLANSVLILVDDVANSGKTLTYALKPFLDQHPRKIQTAVLVARTHKLFPIQADYIGFSLATTLQEYIDVEVKDGKIEGAWVA